MTQKLTTSKTSKKIKKNCKQQFIFQTNNNDIVNNKDNIIKIEADQMLDFQTINKQIQQMKNKPIINDFISPTELKQKFQSLYPLVIQKPKTKKRAKATNIPKFLLKVFNNNLPQLSHAHKLRIKQFFNNLSNSKTRFDLVKLFGKDYQNKQIDQQNQINRNILTKLLTRNFDNILKNKHIRNKKLYLLFCKKVILRLCNPNVIDRLQI